MKKNYPLILIALFLSLNTFSQGPWTFTNSNDGWASTGTAANVTMGATYSTLDINGAGNPQITRSDANIDGTTNIYAKITVQNNTSNTLLRVIYNTSGSNRFVNTLISTNDTSFQTYYIKLDANMDWNTNPVNNITFQFRSDFNNVGATAVDDGGGDFYIDDIEMVASIPSTPRIDYDFNDTTDEEGFTGVNGVTLSQPVAGEIQLDITNQSPFPRFEQIGTYSVDADAYKGVEVTLINNSSKNILTFTSPSGGNQFAPSTIPVLNDGTTVQTITIDLSNLTNWGGAMTNWSLRFIDNPGSGAQASTGTVIIQEIKFVNAVLSVAEENFINTVKLFPNPVNDILNFTSSKQIERLEVYNLLGKKVFAKKSIISNTVNLQSLSKGIYLLKLYSDNEIIATKKVIKE